MKSFATWLVLLSATSSFAASPDERIAQMERSVSPLVTIRGETPPVASLAQRMEQLKVRAVADGASMVAIIRGSARAVRQ
jgi:hypothetical protein